MVLILICTITGFLAGLGFVMVKRKLRPGAILSAAFLGLASAGLWKIFRDYQKRNSRFGKKTIYTPR